MWDPPTRNASSLIGVDCLRSTLSLFFFAFLMEVFIDSPFSFRVASFGCFFFSILRSVADAAEEEAANGRTKQRNSPKK